MLGMAGRTLVGLHFSPPTVESLFLRHVFGDILMTIETPLALSLLVEHLVARRTVGLKFGVPIYEFAGHDQGLNILSGRIV